MNTRLAIIRSEGKEHLCYREEECFVDVSYPVSIRPRACFSPSYNKVKSQTKHVWLLTLL